MYIVLSHIELDGVVGRIKISMKHGLRKLSLQRYSTNFVGWINDMKAPWEVKVLLARLKVMIKELEYFEIIHVYREVNSLVAKIASLYIDDELGRLKLDFY